MNYLIKLIILPLSLQWETFSNRGGTIFKVTSPKTRLYHMLWGQGVIVVLVACFWLFAGWLEMVAALLGGLVCVLANFVFIEIFFKDWRKKKGLQLTIAFYVAELVKLFITVLLAVILIRELSVPILPFMVGLITAYMGFWLVGGYIILGKRKRF